MPQPIPWERYEGETHAYLEDGREVQITAPTRHSRWGEVDSNIRQWIIRDDENNVLARGESDGLRAAKSAVIAALNL